MSGGERRVSLPNGHYSASTMGRAASEARRFRHYGSSLSLAEDHGTHELTSRTLRWIRIFRSTCLPKNPFIIPISCILNIIISNIVMTSSSTRLKMSGFCRKGESLISKELLSKIWVL